MIPCWMFNFTYNFYYYVFYCVILTETLLYLKWDLFSYFTFRSLNKFLSFDKLYCIFNKPKHHSTFLFLEPIVALPRFFTKVRNSSLIWLWQMAHSCVIALSPLPLPHMSTFKYILNVFSFLLPVSLDWRHDTTTWSTLASWNICMILYFSTLSTLSVYSGLNQYLKICQAYYR